PPSVDTPSPGRRASHGLPTRPGRSPHPPDQEATRNGLALASPSVRRRPPCRRTLELSTPRSVDRREHPGVKRISADEEAPRATTASALGLMRHSAVLPQTISSIASASTTRQWLVSSRCRRRPGADVLP